MVVGRRRRPHPRRLPRPPAAARRPRRRTRRHPQGHRPGLAAPRPPDRHHRPVDRPATSTWPSPCRGKFNHMVGVRSRGHDPGHQRGSGTCRSSPPPTSASPPTGARPSPPSSPSCAHGCERCPRALPTAATVPWPVVEDWRPSRTLRIAYAVVVVAVALGGVLIIADWARAGRRAARRRGARHRPGHRGTARLHRSAVHRRGGLRGRRHGNAGPACRWPVATKTPTVRTFEPGDPIALLVSRTNPDRVQQVGWGAGTARSPYPRLAAGRRRRAHRPAGLPGPPAPHPGGAPGGPENWRRERDLNPRGGFTPPNRLAGGHLRPLGHPSIHALTCTFAS